MEEKRGTKHACSPSKEGSPSPSDDKTPLLVPSGSLPAPGSLSEVSSCRPRSSVFMLGGPSGKASVIDLSSSSDEEDLIIDTSHNEEFAKRLTRSFLSRSLGSVGTSMSEAPFFLSSVD
jgi:hypothetical protein